MSVLFSPARVGRLQVENRFIRSATYEGMGDGDGGVTPEALRLYERLGRGGIGTIITGYMYVSQKGKPVPQALGLHDDRLLPGAESLAEAIKTEGSRAVFQLVHAGGQSTKKFTGTKTVGPSGHLRDPVFLEKPRAMSPAEIREVIRDFTRAAGRAKKAGADGVQLHAAHGYLLSQFLSPFHNCRNDEFGGTEEGRYRILGEIIGAVRAEVGPDFALMVKMNLDDGLGSGGITPDSAAHYAARLAEDGLDLLEVSAGSTSRAPFMVCRGEIHHDDFVSAIPWPVRALVRRRLQRSPQPAWEEGWNVPLAAGVKDALGGVPLAVVGGMRNVALMEEFVSSGRLDFVSLSRPLIREPGLVKKFQSDPTAEPSCISCSRCLAACFNALPLRCYVKGLPV
jgi:2,4-dienoyl-CoA reductase-like NADH-dependent reductase (Old Yellow Enzyme family)